MRDGFVKVAAATPQIRVADCAYNRKKILEQIQKMAMAGAKVMVFPELCLTGASCQDLFFQQTLLDAAKEAALELARETKEVDALIFVGLPLACGNKLYNAAAALNRGRILGAAPKAVLDGEEARQFASGEGVEAEVDFGGRFVPLSEKLLFVCREYPLLTVGAELGEDLWTPVTPGTGHVLAGANLLANPCALAETVGADAARRGQIAGTSARLCCAYVCAMAGEGESTQDQVYGGRNRIAENGAVLAEGRRFENCTICGEVDLARVEGERRRRGSFFASPGNAHRRVSFDLNVEETVLTRRYPKSPFLPEGEEQRAIRCGEILEIQALGLKKRLAHIQGKRAVVGLSGGLDSTLALLVMARAFDLLNLPRSGILAVTMPCFGTTDRTYRNACILAKRIGAVLKEVDIKEAVTVHFRDIGQSLENHDVAFENAQARERTQVLMDLANQTGALVVGTGDLSELALGWATYNGDHMSMYGVNGGVPKTFVRHLVGHYANICEDKELASVLLDILDTPVSPELLPPKDGVIAQRTEDLVGPYELHDFFLYYVLREGFSPRKICRLAVLAFGDVYEREILLKWMKNFYRRFFSQQFKRSCLPDGPRVGSVSVSPRGALRMPSDASAALWMKELEEL